MIRILSILLISFALISCTEKDSYDPAHDYFTYANTDAFVTRHISLDLDVDFAAKKLIGSATLTLKVLDAEQHRNLTNFATAHAGQT